MTASLLLGNCHRKVSSPKFNVVTIFKSVTEHKPVKATIPMHYELNSSKNFLSVTFSSADRKKTGRQNSRAIYLSHIRWRNSVRRQPFRINSPLHSAQRIDSKTDAGLCRVPCACPLELTASEVVRTAAVNNQLSSAHAGRTSLNLNYHQL